ncbi:DUF1707 domain-containing protein [Streptomyces spinosirectus]|jgi:hypothetical protein|uniref:DUF1707 SHOCT-like domain-containing protein n=1 Tax=Streptomyces TaxID=1883 RepID=UPI000D346254|nr:MULTISPECIES: DUF1707 domain-containing protein [Streptomyces]MBY8345252.1 DUF1707 and DUF2154 domain-containing protein [Streptomyces plumbidurans]PTM91149.1 uncharacterized protein DUF1707 [Streptomyces sp. VMFN-G11Ma]UIR20142.1 DUF1707 domain-containing protein [Streptomyces spinosirectus]
MSDDAAVPELRASDADRERVAEVLRDALAEGRLDMAEFEERLEATYKARTYGELAPITRDLPVGGITPPPVVSLTKEPVESGSWAGRVSGGEGSSSWAVAVLSGFERRGRWTVPKQLTCVTFLGGGELDLREANFADREVEINCVAIMGGVNIIVPPGVEVVVRGIGIMGGFDHRESGVPGEPGAPRVIVNGFAFWGGVGVERKLTREERRRLKEERRQGKLDRRSSLRELAEDYREDAHDAHRRLLDSHHDLLRERHEERRERHEERRRRHRERREERDRRRYGDY